MGRTQQQHNAGKPCDTMALLFFSGYQRDPWKVLLSNKKYYSSKSAALSRPPRFLTLSVNLRAMKGPHSHLTAVYYKEHIN